MSSFATRRRPEILALALAGGLAAANAARVLTPAAFLAAGCAAMLARRVPGARTAFLAAGLVLLGWWWGSFRLDALDRSPLSARLNTAERSLLVVTGPVRATRYDLRVPALMLRFGTVVPHEPVLLELPRGRAPPQGAVVEAIVEVAEPRPARNGFDERTWLRRHGIHVVARGSVWRQVGRRGGIGGVADAIRRRLRRSVARGLHGSRAGVVEGVVLGEDSGLSNELRRRFRAAGLYHLLAVSGQNVALVAVSVLVLAWLIGMPRPLGEVGALAAIGGYVLAVGAQPSVVRAGIAGALASLASLSARTADRWHLLLVGAIALLAWNPYTLLDPGFQFSFAAVLAIFVLVPRFERFLEGYPLGARLRLVVAVSAACGLATAPVAWLQFHAVQLLTVPANALAAPAVVPLLVLALATAAVAPLSGGAAAALAWLNGWFAAYLVTVARVIGGLPFAQVERTRSLLLLLAGCFGGAAYASERWRRSSSLST